MTCQKYVEPYDFGASENKRFNPKYMYLDLAEHLNQVEWLDMKIINDNKPILWNKMCNLNQMNCSNLSEQAIIGLNETTTDLKDVSTAYAFSEHYSTDYEKYDWKNARVNHTYKRTVGYITCAEGCKTCNATHSCITTWDPTEKIVNTVAECENGLTCSDGLDITIDRVSIPSFGNVTKGLPILNFTHGALKNNSDCPAGCKICTQDDVCLMRFNCSKRNDKDLGRSYPKLRMGLFDIPGEVEVNTLSFAMDKRCQQNEWDIGNMWSDICTIHPESCNNGFRHGYYENGKNMSFLKKITIKRTVAYDSNNETRSTKISNCVEYLGDICLRTKVGFGMKKIYHRGELIQTDVFACKAGCATCTENECLKAIDGFGLDQNNNIIPCIEGCSACNNLYSCIAAKPGWALDFMSVTVPRRLEIQGSSNKCTGSGGTISWFGTCEDETVLNDWGDVCKWDEVKATKDSYVRPTCKTYSFRQSTGHEDEKGIPSAFHEPSYGHFIKPPDVKYAGSDSAYFTSDVSRCQSNTLQTPYIVKGKSACVEFPGSKAFYNSSGVMSTFKTDTSKCASNTRFTRAKHETTNVNEIYKFNDLDDFPSSMNDINPCSIGQFPSQQKWGHHHRIVNVQVVKNVLDRNRKWLLPRWDRWNDAVKDARPSKNAERVKYRTWKNYFPSKLSLIDEWYIDAIDYPYYLFRPVKADFEIHRMLLGWSVYDPEKLKKFFDTDKSADGCCKDRECRTCAAGNSAPLEQITIDNTFNGYNNIFDTTHSKRHMNAYAEILANPYWRFESWEQDNGLLNSKFTNVSLFSGKSCACPEDQDISLWEKQEDGGYTSEEKFSHKYCKIGNIKNDKIMSDDNKDQVYSVCHLPPLDDPNCAEIKVDIRFMCSKGCSCNGGPEDKQMLHNIEVEHSNGILNWKERQTIYFGDSENDKLRRQAETLEFRYPEPPGKQTKLNYPHRLIKYIYNQTNTTELYNQTNTTEQMLKQYKEVYGSYNFKGYGIKKDEESTHSFAERMFTDFFNKYKFFIGEDCRTIAENINKMPMRFLNLLVKQQHSGDGFNFVCDHYMADAPIKDTDMDLRTNMYGCKRVDSQYRCVETIDGFGVNEYNDIIPLFKSSTTGYNIVPALTITNCKHAVNTNNGLKCMVADEGYFVDDLGRIKQRPLIEDNTQLCPVGCNRCAMQNGTIQCYEVMPGWIGADDINLGDCTETSCQKCNNEMCDVCDIEGKCLIPRKGYRIAQKVELKTEKEKPGFVINTAKRLFSQSDEFCLTPSEKYYIDNNEARPCSANCKRCDALGCIEAADGYVINGTTLMTCDKHLGTEGCKRCTASACLSYCPDINSFGKCAWNEPCSNRFCNTCNINKTCTEPIDGYYLNNNGFIDQCMTGCKRCNKMKCLELHDGYFVQGSTLQPTYTCPDHCIDCNDTYCFEADIGYTDSVALDDFKPCMDNCSRCDNSTCYQWKALDNLVESRLIHSYKTREEFEFRGTYDYNGVQLKCPEETCLSCPSGLCQEYDNYDIITNKNGEILRYKQGWTRVNNKHVVDKNNVLPLDISLNYHKCEDYVFDRRYNQPKCIRCDHYTGHCHLREKYTNLDLPSGSGSDFLRIPPGFDYDIAVRVQHVSDMNFKITGKGLHPGYMRGPRLLNNYVKNKEDVFECEVELMYSVQDISPPEYYYKCKNEEDIVTSCGEGCKKCIDTLGAATCLETYDGWGKHGYKVIKCAPGCKECDERKCITPMEGYHVIDSDSHPAKCPYACETCDKNRCTKLRGNVTSIQTVKDSITYYTDYWSTKTVDERITCPNGCLRCTSNECLEAEPGFQLTYEQVNETVTISGPQSEIVTDIPRRANSYHDFIMDTFCDKRYFEFHGTNTLRSWKSAEYKRFHGYYTANDGITCEQVHKNSNKCLYGINIYHGPQNSKHFVCTKPMRGYQIRGDTKLEKTSYKHVIEAHPNDSNDYERRNIMTRWQTSWNTGFRQYLFSESGRHTKRIDCGDNTRDCDVTAPEKELWKKHYVDIMLHDKTFTRKSKNFDESRIVKKDNSEEVTDDRKMTMELYKLKKFDSNDIFSPREWIELEVKYRNMHSPGLFYLNKILLPTSEIIKCADDACGGGYYHTLLSTKSHPYSVWYIEYKHKMRITTDKRCGREFDTTYEDYNGGLYICNKWEHNPEKVHHIQTNVSMHKGFTKLLVPIIYNYERSNKCPKHCQKCYNTWKKDLSSNEYIYKCTVPLKGRILWQLNRNDVFPCQDNCQSCHLNGQCYEVIGGGTYEPIGGTYHTPCPFNCSMCNETTCLREGIDLSRNNIDIKKINNRAIIIACPSNCKTCYVNGTCKEAMGGYAIDEDNIIQCEYGCRTCDKYGQCGPQDRYHTIEDAIPQKCMKNCKHCSNNSVCEVPMNRFAFELDIELWKDEYSTAYSREIVTNYSKLRRCGIGCDVCRPKNKPFIDLGVYEITKRYDRNIGLVTNPLPGYIPCPEGCDRCELLWNFDFPSSLKRGLSHVTLALRNTFLSYMHVQGMLDNVNCVQPAFGWYLETIQKSCPEGCKVCDARGVCQKADTGWGFFNHGVEWIPYKNQDMNPFKTNYLTRTLLPSTEGCDNPIFYAKNDDSIFEEFEIDTWVCASAVSGYSVISGNNVIKCIEGCDSCIDTTWQGCLSLKLDFGRGRGIHMYGIDKFTHPMIYDSKGFDVSQTIEGDADPFCGPGCSSCTADTCFEDVEKVVCDPACRVCDRHFRCHEPDGGFGLVTENASFIINPFITEKRVEEQGPLKPISKSMVSESIEHYIKLLERTAPKKIPILQTMIRIIFNLD